MKIAKSWIPVSLKLFPDVFVTDTSSSSLRSIVKNSDEVKHVAVQNSRSCDNPGSSLQNALQLGWLLKHVCLSLLLVHYPLGIQCFVGGPWAEEHKGNTWASVCPAAYIQAQVLCFLRQYFLCDPSVSTSSPVIAQKSKWSHFFILCFSYSTEIFQKGNLNFN